MRNFREPSTASTQSYIIKKSSGVNFYRGNSRTARLVAESRRLTKATYSIRHHSIISITALDVIVSLALQHQYQPQPQGHEGYLGFSVCPVVRHILLTYANNNPFCANGCHSTTPYANVYVMAIPRVVPKYGFRCIALLEVCVFRCVGCR